MIYPRPGEEIKIKSYKHNGALHRVWNSSTVLQTGITSWIVGNDRILVKEADGNEWRTKEPAICTFGKGQWFNTIGMLREDGVHYYCNIGSPYRWQNAALQYIDYDLDVKVFPDMTYVILDQDEYDEHRRRMNYPETITHEIKRGLDELLSLIHQKKGPFEADYVERWYERYLQYK
jgi:protein associated with RNAse G/E